VDALAAAEGQDWVFHGANFLRPAPGEPHRLALLAFSPDGGDANRYREFDVEARGFVDPADSGFDLPTGKGNASWLDGDTLLVATTAEDLPRTTSSYARTGVKLRRGESLTQAERIFDIPEDHMMAIVAHDSTPGFERTFAVDWISFFEKNTSVLRDGEWVQIDVPADVNLSSHRDWLLFRPQRDWTVNGTTHPAGSLLAAGFEDYLAGGRDLAVLFTPDPHTSLQSWSWTRDFLLLNLLRDVSSEIHVLDPRRPGTDSAWAATVLDACPPLHDVNAFAVDDEDDAEDLDDDGTGGDAAISEGEAPGAGNDFWLVATGFTTPTTLTRGTLTRGSGSGADARVASTHEVIRTSPSFFNEADYDVQQHFAVSKDGTKVPYFQVGARDLVLDGQNPTQLSGYGGFEISRTPAYSGAVGRAWLERRTAESNGAEGEAPHRRGGVYVVANIRGGGEYGPSWHRAALQGNRHRAYEDFAAVARDLISRGVTSRERLGCVGGSNGGLLVGNMLTQYPELFGAVSCGVPLLDMRRYSKLSAGYSWIGEYGDPDVPEQWEFLKTFSPYHLLRDGVDYPETFIWTATSDDRVGPVQARKMAARMQAMGIPNVWFHEALEGGHAGASDNRQAAALQSRSQHFLWRALAGREA